MGRCVGRFLFFCFVFGNADGFSHGGDVFNFVNANNKVILFAFSIKIFVKYKGISPRLVIPEFAFLVVVVGYRQFQSICSRRKLGLGSSCANSMKEVASKTGKTFLHNFY